MSIGGTRYIPKGWLHEQHTGCSTITPKGRLTGMDNVNSSFSLRHKFLAFLTIGLLVAAGIGVLVWKTSASTGTSSTDAGPMLVTTTPKSVNTSDQVSTTTRKAIRSSTTSPSATATRATNSNGFEQPEPLDPLLPPNAFLNSPNLPAFAGEVAGVQETVRTSDSLPSPATSGSGSTRPLRTRVEDTSRSTPKPPRSTFTPAEPTEDPKTPISTAPQKPPQYGEESPQVTISDNSPTGVISETNKPLLPVTGSTVLGSTEPTPVEPSATQSPQPAGGETTDATVSGAVGTVKKTAEGTVEESAEATN